MALHHPVAIILGLVFGVGLFVGGFVARRYPDLTDARMQPGATVEEEKRAGKSIGDISVELASP